MSNEVPEFVISGNDDDNTPMGDTPFEAAPLDQLLQSAQDIDEDEKSTQNGQMGEDVFSGSHQSLFNAGLKDTTNELLDEYSWDADAQEYMHSYPVTPSPAGSTFGSHPVSIAPAGGFAHGGGTFGGDEPVLVVPVESELPPGTILEPVIEPNPEPELVNVSSVTETPRGAISKQVNETFLNVDDPAAWGQMSTENIILPGGDDENDEQLVALTDPNVKKKNPVKVLTFAGVILLLLTLAMFLLMFLTK
jgi:hypothetical protein